MVVNYKEQGFQDSGCDSDYEVTPKPPQPLDNKSYPSASRIATQCLIENNKANRQSDGSLPAATEPVQKSARTGDTNTENNTLPEATKEPATPMIPDETLGMNTVLTDTTRNQPNAKLPDATQPTLKGELPDETDTKDDDMLPAEPNDAKPSRGVFKAKTITIRRAKDPHTFKCSVCGIRAPTLHELNAHFIKNHHNIDCDICGKSFLIPASLRKHRYSHIEESKQFQCRTCEKPFPFKSQLKSH